MLKFGQSLDEVDERVVTLSTTVADIWALCKEAIIIYGLYRHRVERPPKFSNRYFFHDVINLFHTIGVSYPHRVLNSCRFSVWFARFSARWPSDNIIGLLRLGRLYYWLATVSLTDRSKPILAQFLAVGIPATSSNLIIVYLKRSDKIKI